MFSGGLGSWAAAKRVAQGVGTSGLVLLFADTLVEDPDLYRFVSAAARNVGGELVTVKDGRTPFEVFKDDRFLGNARLANCSKYLKQKPCRRWLDENCDPDTTRLYVGIDWSEVHRMPGIVAGWAPYRVTAPMCERPYRDKAMVLNWCKAEGLRPPRAYAEGFPHNNCLQQGCVRGGQAYWATMLNRRKAAYLESERQEQDLREHLDADVSILRDRTGGASTPMTLREFRERVEAQGSFDDMEWGGCGCFTDAPDSLEAAA
jgi:hypothetical protein